MKRLLVISAMVCLLFGFSVAANAAITVTPYEANLGTTEWTTPEAKFGDYSLQLNNPVAGGTNWAGVRISGLGNPTVADFASWDYWTMSNSTQGGLAFHGANITFLLDTSYDNMVIGDLDYGYDVMLNVMPHNMMGELAIPGDTWVDLNSSADYAYQFFAWGATGNYLGGHDISTTGSGGNTWAEFQALNEYVGAGWGYTYDFSNAVIKTILIRTGGGGIISDVTAYLDDFTLNGVTVQVENGFTVIPEPATILVWGLLGLIAAGYGVWRRKR